MAKSTPGRKTLAVHDEAIDAIQRMETLIDLLAALGCQSEALPVEASLVSKAAEMIRSEIGRLRKALIAMSKVAPSKA